MESGISEVWKFSTGWKLERPLTKYYWNHRSFIFNGDIWHHHGVDNNIRYKIQSRPPFCYSFWAIYTPIVLQIYFCPNFQFAPLLPIFIHFWPLLPLLSVLFRWAIHDDGLRLKQQIEIRGSQNTNDHLHFAPALLPLSMRTLNQFNKSLAHHEPKNSFEKIEGKILDRYILYDIITFLASN